ncbi:MAG: hypothetical protein ACRELB_07515 [Polyangiaceae bacterium]
MSVLENQIFANYPYMVACIHHTTKTHKPVKVIDPATGKEVERCPLYPSIPCDVHEQMHGDGCDANYTPAVFIVSPDDKVMFDAEAMKSAGSAGATVQKLEEAQRKLGPGMAVRDYLGALHEIEVAQKDSDGGKFDRAIRLLTRLDKSRAVTAGFRDGRVKPALDAIEAKGKEMLEDARSKHGTDPAGALKELKTIESQWKGLDVAKDAAALRKEWEKK